MCCSWAYVCPCWAPKWLSNEVLNFDVIFFRDVKNNVSNMDNKFQNVLSTGSILFYFVERKNGKIHGK